MGNFSLLDLGKISEPVSKLIDAVSQAVGVVYEPTRIRRRAEATRDAELILAQGKIEQKEMAERAARRLFAQEMRRQENIETIVSQAAHEMPSCVSADPADPDWISRFFLECQDISDDHLRTIWARLLAGEVAQPGSCSRRTLNILQSMSPSDAKLFENAARLVWRDDDGHFVPHVRETQTLTQFGITFDALLDLESLGLLHAQGSFAYGPFTDSVPSYLEYKHILTSCPKPHLESVPSYPITRSGVELLSVLKPKPHMPFYQHILQYWFAKHDIALACPIRADTR